MKIYGVFATIVDEMDLTDISEALKPVSNLKNKQKEFIINEDHYFVQQEKFTKAFSSIIKPHRSSTNANLIVKPSEGYMYPSIAAIASTLFHDKSFVKMLSKGVEDGAPLLLFKVFKSDDVDHMNAVKQIVDNIGEMYFECEYIDLI